MPRFLASTALATVLGTTPALADLTVDDAWNVWKAQFAALGLRHEASETRDGDALQIGELRVTLDFPLGAGSAYLSMPGPRFEPMEGGKVSVTTSPAGLLSIGGEIAGEGSFAMAFEGEDKNSRAVMSGDPGAVVSDWTSDGFSATLVDLAMSGEEVIDISGTLEMGPLTARQETVIADGRVNLNAVTDMTGYDVTYTAKLPDPRLGQMEISGTAMAGKTTNTFQLVLPETGIDLLGMPEQLRSGMVLSMRAVSDKTGSTQSSKVDGEAVTHQGTDMRDYDAFARLDQAGLSYGGKVSAFNADVTMPELPIPISLSGGAVDFRLLLPMLMGEGQDAMLRMGLHDLTLNDGLWAMFDPGEKLPRDPMTVVLDLGSRVSILFEFLDLRALMGGAEPPAVPVMAKTAALKELRLSAAGAELTGTGDVSFDYADWTTFDGIPAPEGRAAFTIKGAHGLIDRLIEMGLMAEGDATGARMMMGLFTRPGEGEDVLTTEIEVRKTGEILANGQPLQ